MNAWILLMVITGVLLLVLAFVSFKQSKKMAAIREKHPGYPKGHWQEKGMGAGVAMGTGIGVAMGKIAIGVAIGVAIGAAIGAGWEKKHKDDIRPITDEERAIKRQSLTYTLSILLVGFLTFFLVYFLNR